MKLNQITPRWIRHKPYALQTQSISCQGTWQVNMTVHYEMLKNIYTVNIDVFMIHRKSNHCSLQYSPMTMTLLLFKRYLACWSFEERSSLASFGISMLLPLQHFSKLAAMLVVLCVSIKPRVTWVMELHLPDVSYMPNISQASEMFKAYLMNRCL